MLWKILQILRETTSKIPQSGTKDSTLKATAKGNTGCINNTYADVDFAI